MSIDSLSRIEISRLEGRASSIRLRQNQFHRLHDVVTASEAAIKTALSESQGYGEDESALEYALALSELRTHYLSLDLKRSVELSHSLEDLTATTGVGIIYLIPAEQNPFYSVISVLTAALAAGNCIVIEVWFCLRHQHQMTRFVTYLSVQVIVQIESYNRVASEHPQPGTGSRFVRDYQFKAVSRVSVQMSYRFADRRSSQLTL